MNSLAQGHFNIVKLYIAMRPQLTDILDDEDLTFQPKGCLSLGALCREIGETQHDYIQSFKTFELKSFDYRHPDKTVESSVEKLKAWYSELDKQLTATIEDLSEEDVQNKIVDRGENFKVPLQVNLSIYTEALLIFHGKASIYLRIMGKDLPEQWQHWIG